MEGGRYGKYLVPPQSRIPDYDFDDVIINPLGQAQGKGPVLPENFDDNGVKLREDWQSPTFGISYGKQTGDWQDLAYSISMNGRDVGKIRTIPK